LWSKNKKKEGGGKKSSSRKEEKVRRVTPTSPYIIAIRAGRKETREKGGKGGI